MTAASGLFILGTLAACDGRQEGDPFVARTAALSQMTGVAADTFIGSRLPDNNSGASASIFTGRDGHGGMMRGLVRFDFPAGLAGRVAVTGVQLTLTTRGFGPTDDVASAAADEALQAVSEAWTPGNGIGDTQMTFVGGQFCAGAITGATWNQPNCGASAAAWMTAGASAVAAVSGTASVPQTSMPMPVTWDSAAAGNQRMISDVQGWIDLPSSNHGWRITSSTEAGPATPMAQRFYASEAGVHAPALVIAYDCKAGLVVSGADCVSAGGGDAGDVGDAAGADRSDGGGGSDVGGDAGHDVDFNRPVVETNGCSCSSSVREVPRTSVMAVLGIAIALAARRRRARTGSFILSRRGP